MMSNGLPKISQPIIFDMYGTLLDESEVYRNFYRYLSKKYNLQLDCKIFLERFFTEQRKYIFANTRRSFKEIVLLSLSKLIEKANRKDTEVLFNSYGDMNFHSGIPELLKKLAQHRELCILTNTDNDLLAKINLEKKSPVQFKKIFTAEDNQVYKPQAKAYQIVVDYFKIPVEKIIYVSSTPWDIKSAKRFGFDVRSMTEIRSL